ncbi:GSCOCG00009847001-RA-CDS [Cotesia congregata]|uniref:Similar to Tbc1d32: Protein broad-minded (Mus musculus) n=1 Tax=Cotesia congregata TaxID=51543 RepID=A0A8J2H2C3_COTCN|nr:GSCOCG00009847001-RA-CDS [Cotesia congregata]CAG5075140.1 Similar to Tbc1d32: Protein broad-minded (Mus musculus) [Cotesia congregata]
MTELTPTKQKWLLEALKSDFLPSITSKLRQNTDIESLVIELTSTPELQRLLAASKQKTLPAEQESACSALSFDTDPWSPFKAQTDIPNLLESLAPSKPNHVRLASFEILLESDLASPLPDEVFRSLLGVLRQGLLDSSSPIFAASLQAYNRLLTTPKGPEVFSSLLSLFDAYFDKKNLEQVPNFNTGVNFKIFFHEKLFRVLHLIISQISDLAQVRPQAQAEETIEEFLEFLTRNSGTLQKNLKVLNLVAILEPGAFWVRKWTRSSAARKIFIAAVTKNSDFLQIVLHQVQTGLQNSGTIVATIENSVFISGETVETLTYFHCLHFMALVFGSADGRQVITEEPSPAEFCKKLVAFLNSSAGNSTSSRPVYRETRLALSRVLTPQFPVDTGLFHLVVKPLQSGKIWAHTVDALVVMAELQDGRAFLMENGVGKILMLAGELLRQPFAVMDVELVVQMFKFLEQFFEVEVVVEELEELMEALEFFYNKIDKCGIGFENWTQQLDAAAKSFVMKIATTPRGLEMIKDRETVLEEVIRGAINPLKNSWDSLETVCFISAAGFFHQARGIMRQLVAQTFSMLLEDIYKNLEEREMFTEPWEQENVKKYGHIVALLALNTECYSIFALDSGDSWQEEEYPRSFGELLSHSLMDQSVYHELSLRVLETMVWNLDILILLMHTYDLQTKLLELQKNCRLEVSKFTEKVEEDEFQEEIAVENEVRGEVSEVHEIYDGYEVYRFESEGESAVCEVHEVFAVDHCAYLRHKILWNSYFFKHKLSWGEEPERVKIFDAFPPAVEDEVGRRSSESESELDELLSECKPGFKDSSWASQIKKAHKSSPGVIKHGTILKLLEQMEQAIPTVEWVEIFQWEEKSAYSWLPEEEIGFDLAARFAEDNCELEEPDKIKENLKEVFGKIHGFIQYEKDGKFRGFDWFLTVIFVVCDGNVERCKGFIKQLVRLPSAVYMWRNLAAVFDTNNEQENGTQFIIARHIEAIVCTELPKLNFALKRQFGIKWWIISDRLLTQMFMGALPWNEILNFLCVCLINLPDYIVYYCVSLLQHCEPIIMKDVIDGNSWPEFLDLSDYKCHDYLSFMDRLAKRYRNKVLPSMTHQASEEENED